MRYAKYVGRVGTLAVALGVGSAAYSMPGIAWAEPGEVASTSSGASDSTSASTPESSSAPTTGTAVDSGSGEAPAGSDNPAGSAATPESATSGSSPSENVDEVAPGVVVSSSGGAHTTGADDAEPEDPQPRAKPVPDSKTSGAGAGSSHTTVTSQPATVDAPASHVSSSGGFTPDETAEPPAQTRTFTLSTPVTAVDGYTSTAVPQSLSVSTAPTTVKQSVPSPNLVTGLFASLLAAFGPGAPGAPAESPALWVLLGWARRQFGTEETTGVALRSVANAQTLTSESVDAAVLLADDAPPVTVDEATPATGAVSGQVTVVDPDGRSVRYAVSEGPANGTVTINSRTGEFTYTPTVLSRVQAGLTPQSETDSFTVTAGSWSNKVPVVVTVPVSPVVLADQSSVTLPDNSYPAAVATSGSRVYVANNSAGTVSVIETASGTAELVDTIDTGSASFPFALATSPDGKRLYVVNSSLGQEFGTVSVIDTTTNTVLDTTVTVGNQPLAIAVDGRGRNVYVANSDGTVSKISTSTLRVSTVTGLPIGIPAAITVSPDGRKIYVANAEDGSISEFSSYSSKAKTVTTGLADPLGLAVSPDNKTVYVASSDGTVSVIETRRYTVVDTFDIGGMPSDVRVSDDGRVLIVADVDESVRLVDASTGEVLTELASDPGLDIDFARMAVSADGAHLYVADADGDGLRVLTLLPRATNAAPTTAGDPTADTPDAGTGAVNGSLQVSDADDDALTYTVVDGPRHGTVTVDPADGGSYLYTPTAKARHAASATGADAATTTDTFTVAVSDGYGAVHTIVVTVAVDPTNADPTTKTHVGRPSWSTGRVTGSVTGRDADRDKLTYEGSTTTSKGTVIVDSRGRFTYTPTAEARHEAAADDATADELTDSFTVTVDDGHGGTVDVPISVSIRPDNEDPDDTTVTVGQPDSDSGVVTGAISGVDEDGDTVTYSASQTTKGEVVLNSDGTFTYTPTLAAQLAAGADGARSSDKYEKFTITADDGHGGTDTARVTVTIAPVSPNPAVIGAVDVGDGPDDVVVSADGRYVYTANYGTSFGAHDGSVTVLDTSDNTTTTIAIGGTVYGVAAAPNGTRVYAVSSNDTDDGGTVSIIDTATNAVTDSFELSAGNLPSSVAITPDGETLVVASHDGTMTIIDTADNTAIRTLNVRGYGNQIAITPDGREVWVAHDDNYPQTSVITLSNGRVTDLAVGDYPSTQAVVVSPDGKFTYVLGDGVAVIKNGWRDTLSTTMSGLYGDDLAVSPDGRYLYVAQADGALQVVDVKTGTVAKTVNIGGSPSAIAISADGTRIFVTNISDGTVTVLNAYSTNAAPTVSVAVGDPDPETGEVTGRITVGDPDGDAVTLDVGTATTAKGSVTVNLDGTFTYMPTDDARHLAAATSGPATDKVDSFAVTVSDARGRVTTATVAVPIATTNIAPTAAGFDALEGFSSDGDYYGDFVDTYFDSSLAGERLYYDAATGVFNTQMSAADAEGDNLTFSGSTTTAKGTVAVTTEVVDRGNGFQSRYARVVYTPTYAARHAADAVDATIADKTDSFVVVIDDGHGGVTNVPFTVALVPANAQPVIAGWAGETDPVTGVVTGHITAVDSDGDPLTFESPSDQRNLVVNSDGTFVYKPTATDRLDAATGGLTKTLDATVFDGHGRDVYTGEYGSAGNFGRNGQIDISVSPSVLDHNLAATQVLDGFSDVIAMKAGSDGRMYVVQEVYDDDPAHPSLVVIDPDRNFLTTSIALDGLAHVADVGLTPDNHVYVLGSTYESRPWDTNTVLRVDVATGSVSAVYHDDTQVFTKMLVTEGDQLYLTYPLEVRKVDLTDDSTLSFRIPHDEVINTEGSQYSYLLGERSPIDDIAVSGDGHLYVVHGAYDEGVEIFNADGTLAHFQTPGYEYGGIQLITAPDGTVLVSAMDRNGSFASSTIGELKPDGSFGPVLTEHFPGNMVFSDAGDLFVLHYDFGELQVIDPATNSMTTFDSELVDDLLGPDRFMGIDSEGRVYGLDDDGYYVAGDRAVHRSAIVVFSPVADGTTPPDAPAHFFTNPTSYLYNHLRHVTSYEHSIVVERVHGYDDQDRLIVYIGGTTQDVLGDNQSWVDNVPKAIAGTLDPDLIPTLDQAVADYPDLPIMLVGYSQGGIDAQNIAASGRYRNVTAVVTYGTVVTKAPISGTIPPIPSNIHVLHLIDENDPISYYFTNPVTLAENKSIGTVFMWHGGVAPEDPDYFWGEPLVNFPAGYLNVHTDETTYDNIGIEFDNPTVDHGVDYTTIKTDLNNFRGETEETWRSPFAPDST